VEVELDPKLVREGHDPQLERAVAVALQQLKEHPAPQPSRPAYPNYQRPATNTSTAPGNGNGGRQ
jgi:tricorn protease